MITIEEKIKRWEKIKAEAGQDSSGYWYAEGMLDGIETAMVMNENGCSGCEHYYRYKCTLPSLDPCPFEK